MKLYVVHYDNYPEDPSENCNLGIFSSEEKAHNFILEEEKTMEGTNWKGDLYILEFELDVPFDHVVVEPL